MLAASKSLTISNRCDLVATSKASTFPTLEDFLSSFMIALHISFKGSTKDDMKESAYFASSRSMSFPSTPDAAFLKSSANDVPSVCRYPTIFGENLYPSEKTVQYYVKLLMLKQLLL